jgi:hypothetical protein
VTINQEAWMQTRTIWTDGRAHEDDPDPTFMGDSIRPLGRATRWWSRRAAFRADLEIDTGWPHSDQFVLTERIHLDPADPNVLVNEMRMDDPEALAEPFASPPAIAATATASCTNSSARRTTANPVDDDGNTQFE